MIPLNLTALATPLRFFDWFHSPARDLAGGIGLAILLLVAIEVLGMVPDLLRMIRMHLM